MRRRKFSSKDREYWAHVLIACSQVTFGVFWAAIFLPIDVYKLFVVLSNLLASIVLWFSGWFLIRRKNVSK